MNIYTDIGILDLLRIQPPFAITYFGPPTGGGVGRPDDAYTASIPHGNETLGTAIGRGDEGTTSIGRAGDQG